MDTSNEYVKRDDVLNAISNFADGFENSLFFKIFIRASLESLNDTLLFLPITRIAKSQHWDFVINEERVGYWEGKIISLYYNGYKCSNCGHGGGEVIPKSYGEMTEQEAKVLFGDMNYKYCPNCGARMENGKNGE